MHNTLLSLLGRLPPFGRLTYSRGRPYKMPLSHFVPNFNLPNREADSVKTISELGPKLDLDVSSVPNLILQAGNTKCGLNFRPQSRLSHLRFETEHIIYNSKPRRADDCSVSCRNVV